MRSARRILRAFLVNALAASLVAGSVAAGALWYVNNRIDETVAAIPDIADCATFRAEAEQEGRALTDEEVRTCIENAGLDVSASDEPVNIVLIGSDSRAFVEDEAQAEVFGEDEGPARSDTLMVAHIDPRSRTGFIVSFPRDLYVEIPGIGRAKINSAYNAGPQKVIEMMQQTFDIPVNHYLEVDFASFEAIVNVVGGVRLFFQNPVKDESDEGATGFVVVRSGCWELDGYASLQYVRARHMQELIDGEWVGDGVPDIARIARQQAFLKKLGATVVAETESNPLRAIDVAEAAIKYLKVDEKFDRRAALGFANAFADVNPYDPTSVRMETFPWASDPTGDDSYAPGSAGAVLYPDWPLADTLLEELRGKITPTGPAPEVAPAAVSVSVLNGSGVEGQARATRDALQQHGFATVGAGNAPKSLSKTEIRYVPGAQDKAALVQSYFAGVGELIEDPTLTDADVVAVLGSDFQGVAAPAAPPAPGEPAPSGPATTTTAPVGLATTAPSSPGSEATLPPAGDNAKRAEDVTRPEDC